MAGVPSKRPVEARTRGIGARGARAHSHVGGGPRLEVAQTLGESSEGPWLALPSRRRGEEEAYSLLASSFQHEASSLIAYSFQVLQVQVLLLELVVDRGVRWPLRWGEPSEGPWLALPSRRRGEEEAYSLLASSFQHEAYSLIAYSFQVQVLQEYKYYKYKYYKSTSTTSASTTRS